MIFRFIGGFLAATLVACMTSRAPTASGAGAGPQVRRVAPPTHLRPAELASYMLAPDDAPTRVLVDQGLLVLAYPQARDRDVMLVWIDPTGTWIPLLELPLADPALPPGIRRAWFVLTDEGGPVVHGYANDDSQTYDTQWPIVWRTDRPNFLVGLPTTTTSACERCGRTAIPVAPRTPLERQPEIVR